MKTPAHAHKLLARSLNWAAVTVFILVALMNVAGYQMAWGFGLPGVFAVGALIFGIQARSRPDVVAALVVILALPVWLLGIIALIAVGHPLANNSFSP